MRPMGPIQPPTDVIAVQRVELRSTAHYCHPLGLEQPLQAIPTNSDAIRAEAQGFARVIVGAFPMCSRAVCVIVGHSVKLSG